MIQEHIIAPYFDFLVANTAVSNFFKMILIYFMIYTIVKFVCKGVIQWYKWFMIS